MNICVIGTGYVGLVTGACLSDLGNHVICVDKDLNKISMLNSGKMPIYETGLEDLVTTGINKNKLKFTDNLNFAVKTSDICFIAVGTPQKNSGEVDLQAVYKVSECIKNSINGYKVIVIKSTVPVGTAQEITEIIKNGTSFDFDVVSNPEFLRQGHAVNDFFYPDRLVIGADNEKAKNIMLELYKPFGERNIPILTMDTKSAEMVKYASNSFLAVKISYINEIANICDAAGADIREVKAGMSTDLRIGSEFLNYGIGYGGSCLAKDINALINTAEKYNVPPEIIKAANNVNIRQRRLFVRKILNRFGKDLTGLTFAVWGLAFKPRTDDMRNAPSIDVINALLGADADIQVYDPQANTNAENIFKNTVKYCQNPYQALENADGLIILTEWDEFKNPNFNKIKKLLKLGVIFDARNLYNADLLYKYNLEYIR